MSHSICCVPVASVRVDPDHRSEMVSQLLFGERAIITFKENGWCKIVSKADAYTGWCLSRKYPKKHLIYRPQGWLADG